jgi:phage shock protein A
MFDILRNFNTTLLYEVRIDRLKDISMAESIFSRVSRLLSARVEDTVDRMEQSGGDAVMRETVREVDRAIDDVKADQEAAMARRLQSVRQQKMLRERVEELGKKAKFAVSEGRDDLAEAAVSRQLDFEQEFVKLEQVQTSAVEEEARLEDSLSALKTRKQQMEESLSAFVISQREASMGGDGAFHNERSVEKQVTRAEAAFDRAMTGAGGVGFTRADAETINRVAEIDSMSRSSVIAERLASLKKAA